jgi:hypothetical protein
MSMPVDERKLLDSYGEAATSGNAALFVGAGLSLSAGLPDWPALLQDVRKQAKIPAGIDDLPLLAQYAVQTLPGGRKALDSSILNQLTTAVPNGSSTLGYNSIEELPVGEIWTTNYDTLIEDAIRDLDVISEESHLRERSRPSARRLLKMHGSLTQSRPRRWQSQPVITRSDYEKYEATHPRLWAALRATYLTKSILFLGFSFTDPNIELLLRLSRTLNVGAPEHFTVLKRPTGDRLLRLHDLRTTDLERSGIAVCEVDNFAELNPLLNRLVRRTRERNLFIGGSTKGDSIISECSRVLGHNLAAADITLVSFAGPTAMRLSYAFGRALFAEQKYKYGRIKFFFRQSQKPPPPLTERIGTAVYTNFPEDRLRLSVLSGCRAAAFLGGGDRTRAEMEKARSLGVAVIPLATTGGQARVFWQEIGLDGSGISAIPGGDRGRDWDLLSSDDVHIAVSAAGRLIRSAMFI